MVVVIYRLPIWPSLEKFRTKLRSTTWSDLNTQLVVKHNHYGSLHSSTVVVYNHWTGTVD